MMSAFAPERVTVSATDATTLTPLTVTLAASGSSWRYVTPPARPRVLPPLHHPVALRRERLDRQRTHATEPRR